MTTAAQIRAGFKTALAALESTDPAFNVLDYMGAPTGFPTIQFFPEKISYDGGENLDEWEWVVQAFLGAGLMEASQLTLETLIDPGGTSSVKYVMETDRTLGGVVDDLRVSDAELGVFRKEDGGLVLGATWTVHVLKSR